MKVEKLSKKIVGLFGCFKFTNVRPKRVIKIVRSRSILEYQLEYQLLT